VNKSKNASSGKLNANASRKDNRLRRDANRFLRREKESKKSRNKRMNLEQLIWLRDKLKEMLVERSRTRTRTTTEMLRVRKLLHLVKIKSRKRMRKKMSRTKRKLMTKIKRMLRKTMKSLRMKL